MLIDIFTLYRLTSEEDCHLNVSHIFIFYLCICKFTAYMWNVSVSGKYLV